MTKLESTSADPIPELIGPTRTSVIQLDDDSCPPPISWSRSRLVSTGAILLACLVLAILFETIRIYPPYDLGVYQRAAWAMLLGVDPYPPYLPQGDAPFTYTPFAGWLFAPFAPIPEELLAWLWLFASLALLAWVIRRALLLAPGLAAEPNGARTTAIVIGSLALATVADPVWDHLSFGQMSIVLMAACLYDLLGPRDQTRTRKIPQGMLIGLAAAVKLTPAIFVIYLLLTRRTRAACVATAIGATLAAAIASPAPSRTFFFDLLWRLDARVGLGGLHTTIWNQSIKGALWRLVPGSLVSPLWAVAALLIGASGMWLARMAWERRATSRAPARPDWWPRLCPRSAGCITWSGLSRRLYSSHALAAADRSDLCWRNHCDTLRAEFPARRDVGAPHSFLAMGYRGDRAPRLIPVAIGQRRLVARSIRAALCYACSHAAPGATHVDRGVTIAGAKPKVPAYRRRRFSPNGGLARRVDGANLKDVFRRIDTNPHFCASSAQTRKRIKATPEKMAAPSDKDAEKRTVGESTPRD